jgi:hypothetical protein
MLRHTPDRRPALVGLLTCVAAVGGLIAAGAAAVTPAGATTAAAVTTTTTSSRTTTTTRTSTSSTTTTTTSSTSTSTPPGGHSILASRQLWATVDVCNQSDHPHTIGVRGSMPGDGVAAETMFMRFRIQYRDPKTNQWLDISANADSGDINVGSSRFRVREAGRSFIFEPVPNEPAYRLRGVVLFQWKRGSTVVRSTTRYTQSGHMSAAGADPKDYSASTCIIS